MKLYKYISFAKSHWKEPLETGKLYFPTLEELKRANDPAEFSHHWETDSHFFNTTKTVKNLYGIFWKNSKFSKAELSCIKPNESHADGDQVQWRQLSRTVLSDQKSDLTGQGVRICSRSDHRSSHRLIPI